MAVATWLDPFCGARRWPATGGVRRRATVHVSICGLCRTCPRFCWVHPGDRTAPRQDVPGRGLTSYQQTFSQRDGDVTVPGSNVDAPLGPPRGGGGVGQLTEVARVHGPRGSPPLGRVYSNTLHYFMGIVLSSSLTRGSYVVSWPEASVGPLRGERLPLLCPLSSAPTRGPLMSGILSFAITRFAVSQLRSCLKKSPSLRPQRSAPPPSSESCRLHP